MSKFRFFGFLLCWVSCSNTAIFSLIVPRVSIFSFGATSQVRKSSSCGDIFPCDQDWSWVSCHSRAFSSGSSAFWWFFLLLRKRKRIHDRNSSPSPTYFIIVSIFSLEVFFINSDKRLNHFKYTWKKKKEKKSDFFSFFSSFQI